MMRAALPVSVTRPNPALQRTRRERRASDLIVGPIERPDNTREGTVRDRAAMRLLIVLLRTGVGIAFIAGLVTPNGCA